MGKRSDFQVELESAEKEILAKVQEALSDTITAVTKNMFEFTIHKTISEKRMAVFLIQTDSPKNNLAGFRLVALQPEFKDKFDFFYYNSDPAEIPQLKLQFPKNIFIFMVQDLKEEELPQVQTI